MSQGREHDGADFVWPPRTPGPGAPAPHAIDAAAPVPSAAPITHTQGSASAPHSADIAPGRSTHESKLFRPSGPPPAGHRELRGSQGGSQGWWSEVERVWLSVTAPVLLERAAAAGWVPDGPEHYCRRCGASARAGEQAADQEPAGCEACRGKAIAWDRLVRLGEYEAPLDRWVHEVKYTRFRALGEGLGRWLGESIAAEIERARAARPGEIPDGPPVIVPVPMSFVHRLSRGIDHTMTICRGVRQSTGGTIVRALTRGHRPSQLDVLHSDRQANVAGAFRARRSAVSRLEGRLVVVVDDVTTTGATLRGCVRSVQGLFRRTGGKGKARRCPPIWVAAAAWTGPERGTGLES